MAQEETDDPDRMVAVYAAPDAISAQMMQGLLESEGIFAAIGEQVNQYATYLQMGEGFWGEVCVRAEDRERARTIVLAAVAGALAVSDDELEAAASQSYDPDV